MPRRKRRAGAGRRGRPSLLSSLPTAQLQQEIERRLAMVDQMRRRRDELIIEIESINNELSAFGESSARSGGASWKNRAGRRGPGRPPGSGAGKRRGRRPGRRNASSLVESLRGVLSGKTMSVSEVAEQVQKAGYKTTSPNFRTIVNQALLANKNTFRKVSRGQYTAK